MIQGIPTADKASADSIRTQVDASCGFPRCDRLSGTLAAVAIVTCPCTKATAPDPRCPFRTDADALPVMTASGWAYPVAGDPKTMASLTPQQRSQVVALPDATVAPVGAAQVAAEVVTP